MNTPTLGTRQNAVALNLDAKTYGTIAEIGGGQEVARWMVPADVVTMIDVKKFFSGRRSE